MYTHICMHIYTYMLRSCETPLGLRGSQGLLEPEKASSAAVNFGFRVYGFRGGGFKD